MLWEKGFAGFVRERGGKAFKEHAQVGVRLNPICLGCLDQAVIPFLFLYSVNYPRPGDDRANDLGIILHVEKRRT